MQKFPKIGLPVIFIIGAIILLISKSAVTIGPGEGGVLFERFGDGIKRTKPTVKAFKL